MLFGDNAYLKLWSCSEDALKKIINLADLKANAYKVENKVLSFHIVHNNTDPSMNHLPALLKGNALHSMIIDWLVEQPYDPEPDHDGDNKRGYEFGAGDYHKGFWIKPHWIRFGK